VDFHGLVSYLGRSGASRLDLLVFRVSICHFWCFSCSRLKICGFACLRVLGFDGLDCVRLPAFGHICCQVAILVLGCSCGLGIYVFGGHLCHFR